LSPSPLTGIVLVVCAVACFAALDTTAKIVTATLPVMFALWFRYAFQAVVTTVIMWPQRKSSLWQTRKHGQQVLRGTLLLLTSMLTFISLTFMPVGEFTAVAMTSPLVVTLLAAWLLGEQVSGLRWLLIAGGFAGTLCIVKPGGQLWSWLLLVPMFQVLTYALFQILTSRMLRTEDAITTFFYTGWVGTALATPPLLVYWVTPDTWQQWVGLLVMGITGSLGHFCLIHAFRKAAAATLTPIFYVQIGVAVWFGWLMFAHAPDGWSVFGMVLIAFCGISSTWLAVRKPAPGRPL
jgi:drug/metabolite transporter (DMT)-like permease